MSYNQFHYYILLTSVGLFLGMLLAVEVGRLLGARRIARDPKATRIPLGAVEGAVFALLGLLIAFTFSGAASRFDDRRQLCAKEANAIGTAYLRTELLDEPARQELRAEFRCYVEARLEVANKLPDVDAAWQQFEKATEIERRIWRQAVAACRQQESRATTTLVLSALNQMIDLTATRVAATMRHPPLLIYGMLAALALVAAMIAGYGMAPGKTRSWLHTIGFAAIIAATLYVILDLESPRLGLVRLKEADEFMSRVLEMME